MIRAALLLMLCNILLFPAGMARADTLADTVERVRPAIVGIGTVLPGRDSMLLGTGFAVGDGRHVLTNAHVIDRVLDVPQNERFAVFSGRGNGARVVLAEKVAIDRKHDLVLLRIEGGPLPVLELGDSSRVREGEAYAFTGFPIGDVLGLYPATHRATVAAITPSAAPMGSAGRMPAHLIERLREQTYDIFQLDATAYPGNSGSPLYDVDTGVVIGILNMVFVKGARETVLERPSGIAYAIPIRHARAFLADPGRGDASD